MRAPAISPASHLGRLALALVALMLATVSMTTPAKADEPSDAETDEGAVVANVVDEPADGASDAEGGAAPVAADVTGSEPVDAPTLASYLSSGMLRVSADVALVDGDDEAVEPVVGSFTVDGLTYAIVGEGEVALVAVSPRTLAGGLVGGLEVASDGGLAVGSSGAPSGEGSGSGVPPRSGAEQVPSGATSPSPSPEEASSDDAEAQGSDAGSGPGAGDEGAEGPAAPEDGGVGSGVDGAEGPEAVGSDAAGDDEPAALTLPDAVSHDGSDYSLTAIGPRALAGCDAATVVLPASVASVDQAAFEGSSVASVEVADGNPHLSSYDGMLFDAEQTSLLLVPEGKQGAARVPSTAEVVDPSRFSHSAGVDAISVEAGSAAFSSRNGCLYDASGETLLRVPAGATEIQIADGCATVAAGSMEGCSKLATIHAPASVTEVHSSEHSSRIVVDTSRREDGALWRAAGFQATFAQQQETGSEADDIAEDAAVVDLSDRKLSKADDVVFAFHGNGGLFWLRWDWVNPNNPADIIKNHGYAASEFALTRSEFLVNYNQDNTEITVSGYNPSASTSANGWYKAGYRTIFYLDFSTSPDRTMPNGTLYNPRTGYTAQGWGGRAGGPAALPSEGRVWLHNYLICEANTYLINTVSDGPERIAEGTSWFKLVYNTKWTDSHDTQILGISMPAYKNYQALGFWTEPNRQGIQVIDHTGGIICSTTTFAEHSEIYVALTPKTAMFSTGDEDYGYITSGGNVSSNASDISISFNGGTMIFGSKGAYAVHFYKDGKLNEITLKRPGYRQTGWEAKWLENGESLGPSFGVNDSGTYGGITAGVRYVAEWTEQTYTVSLDATGGSVSDAGFVQDSETGQYKRNYSVNSTSFGLPTPERAGYTFAGWELGKGWEQLKSRDGVPVRGSGAYLANASTNYYVVGKGTYGDFTCTAQWVQNSASLMANDDDAGDYGGTLDYHTWLSPNLVPIDTLKDLVTGGFTWVSDHLMFGSTTGQVGGPFAIHYRPTAVGPLYVVTAKRPAYKQVGWRGESPDGTRTVSVTGATNHAPNPGWTYIALWEPREYKVTLDADGGELSGGGFGYDEDAGTYAREYTVETPVFGLPNPTRAGYTFERWEWDEPSEDGWQKLPGKDGQLPEYAGPYLINHLNKYYGIAPGAYGDIKCTAVWTKNQATFRANGEGEEGGTLSFGTYSNGVVEPDADMQNLAGPQDVAWEGGTCVFGSGTGQVGGPFAVHYNPVEGGALRWFTAARPGYDQVSWEGSSPDGKEQLSIVAEDDRTGIRHGWTYVAGWAAHVYRVAFDPAGGAWGDAGAGEAVSAAFDQDVTLAAAPKRAGYVFAGWEVTGPDGAAYSFEGGATLAGGKLKAAEGDVAAVPISYGERAVEGQEPAATATFTAKWVADLRVDVPIAVDLDLTVDWEQGRVVASGPDGSGHATGEFRSWSSGEVQVAAFGQEAGTAMGHRQGALGLFASGDEAKAGNLMKVSLVLSADADGAQRLSFPLSGLYELPADRPPHGAMASPQDLAPLDLVVPPASSVSSPGTLRVRYGIDCAADLPLSDVAIDERPRPILKLVYKVGLANP